MPRRNNRKHYRNEGRLGFNPDKYISKPGDSSHHHHSRYSPAQLAQSVSRDSRPSPNRHKARSVTRKKRRAMEEIRRMQQTAERVKTTTSQPRRSPVNTPSVASSHPSVATIQSAPVVSTCPTNPATNTSPTSIFGGIKKWLRKALLLV